MSSDRYCYEIEWYSQESEEWGLWCAPTKTLGEAQRYVSFMNGKHPDLLFRIVKVTEIREVLDDGS
jgi:hypothetical protein